MRGPSYGVGGACCVNLVRSQEIGQRDDTQYTLCRTLFAFVCHSFVASCIFFAFNFFCGWCLVAYYLLLATRTQLPEVGACQDEIVLETIVHV